MSTWKNKITIERVRSQITSECKLMITHTRLQEIVNALKIRRSEMDRRFGQQRAIEFKSYMADYYAKHTQDLASMPQKYTNIIRSTESAT